MNALATRNEKLKQLRSLRLIAKDENSIKALTKSINTLRDSYKEEIVERCDDVYSDVKAKFENIDMSEDDKTSLLVALIIDLDALLSERLSA